MNGDRLCPPQRVGVAGRVHRVDNSSCGKTNLVALREQDFDGVLGHFKLLVVWCGVDSTLTPIGDARNR
jgi:hypothetical protein